MSEARRVTLRDPHADRRVAQWVLLERLGAGGAGEVWRARGPDGAEVALKRILRPTPEAQERFGREQRLQGDLGEAQGFVPLLAAGVDAAAGPYLVMPLLAGGTLRERLRLGPLRVEEVVGLGQALAAALGQAHAAGIVHRDLKPENLLYRGPRDRLPLIADLGLAKHFRGPGELSLSSTGQWRGTAGYAPLEQFEDAKRVGPESDVFALGAILWECLAGRPAFPGASLVQILDRLGAGQVPSLREANPRVPPRLAAAIERCLDPDPGRRFADGAELAAALDELDEGTTDVVELLRRGGLVAFLLLLPAWLLCAMVPLPVVAVVPLAVFSLACRGPLEVRAALALLRRRGLHAASALLLMGMAPLLVAGMIGSAAEELRLPKELEMATAGLGALPVLGLLGAALAALPAQVLLEHEHDLPRAWALGAGRRLEGALALLLPAGLVALSFPYRLPWTPAGLEGLRMVGFLGGVLAAHLLLGLLCARHYARGLRDVRRDRAAR